MRDFPRIPLLDRGPRVLHPVPKTPPVDHHKIWEQAPTREEAKRIGLERAVAHGHAFPDMHRAGDGEDNCRHCGGAFKVEGTRFGGTVVQQRCPVAA